MTMHQKNNFNAHTLSGDPRYQAQKASWSSTIGNIALATKQLELEQLVTKGIDKSSLVITEVSGGTDR